MAPEEGREYGASHENGPSGALLSSTPTCPPLKRAISTQSPLALLWLDLRQLAPDSSASVFT